MNSPLEKAIGIVGGQVALASAICHWHHARHLSCRVKQAHVWNWINKQQGLVPPEYAIAIAEITDWHITPHDLRPDIYPHPHDGLPEHVRQAA